MLDLESKASTAAHDQQVKFSAGVRCPEEALLGERSEAPDDLRDGEPLEARPELGWSMRSRRVREASSVCNRPLSAT